MSLRAVGGEEEAGQVEHHKPITMGSWGHVIKYLFGYDFYAKWT